MILDPGLVIAGRYEIIDKIGSGGMANVYRAMDRKLRRYVTFKVMREEYITDEDFIKRFNIEARAAASLLNQHIVNVYDVGQEDSIHYMVMEYVDGVTLKALIKKRAPFENDEILGVAIQIATALEHAHRNNIIHRHIKPQNILVTKSGISKVTDFGIARASTSTTMTTTNNTMGSVHYFSPEQARGGYVDAKSDIYSLGIVMYEMATGKMPFDGDTAIAIALNHINEPLPDIKAINPNISDKIVEIICKATEKMSVNRYQTVTEMANDLKRVLANSEPTDDYVNHIGIFSESPTIKLTSEVIEEIQRETSAANASETRVPPPRRPRSEIMRIDDDLDDDEGIFSEKKVIIAAVITSLVIMLIITLVGYSMLTKNRPTAKKEVNVESFEGMTLDEARVIAESLGITIEVEGEAASDSIAAGNIISQNVGDDWKIYEGEILGVVISVGTDKYEVPDVTNMDITSAYKVFEEKNYPLETEEVPEWHDTVPQTVVIRQDPPGKTMVKAGTVVTLYISNGQKQKTVVVPSLTNMTEAQAIKVLQDLGLAVDHIVRAASATVPEGRVIDQMTNPNTEVPKGTVVQFIISTGPPRETPAPTAGTTDGESKKNTRNLEIELPNIPEGATTVNVLVIKGTASGNTDIFNGPVNVSDLPLKLSVSGEGDAEIMVFTVGADGQSRFQVSQHINFSEGATE